MWHDSILASKVWSLQRTQGDSIRALEGSWTVSGSPGSEPGPHRSWQPTASPIQESKAGEDEDQERRWQGWDRAISAALDEEQLARAVDLTCAVVPPASRIAPAIRVQLIRWAAQTLEQAGTDDLQQALSAALTKANPPTLPSEAAQDLPSPPMGADIERPLRERIIALSRASSPQEDQP